MLNQPSYFNQQTRDNGKIFLEFLHGDNNSIKYYSLHYISLKVNIKGQSMKPIENDVLTCPTLYKQ